jgi:hypothetical protein
MTKRQALFLLVGLLSLAIYVRTLAPTITWRNDGVDSGDLATAVATGGVPHPPGYPTYLVLGEVFKLLPFGDVAYRLNLLSATCAALAAALMGLVTYQTLSTAIPSQLQKHEDVSQVKRLPWLCAAAAALTLAFSGPYWSQAVITEVYALNALFAAALFYAGLQAQVANQSWLVPVLASLLGLSLGNHTSILLLLPMLVWMLKVRWRWDLIVTALLAFCTGLSVYLIIPLRASTVPPVNWGAVTTLPNFVWLVSAEPYRQFLFALPWQAVPARLAAELHLLTRAFMGWGLPVGLLGLWSLIRHNPYLGYSSLLTFLFISIFSIGYNTADSYVYLLPAFLMFSLWIGWGLYDLGNTLHKMVKPELQCRSLITWGLLLLPLLSLSLNFPGQNISRDDEALNYAERSLELVAPGAVIIADNDHQTFALWYAHYGLGLRPDVAVINSNLLSYAWYRQALRQTHANLHLSDEIGGPLTTLPAFIEGNLHNPPIYLATLEPSPMQDYRLEPLGQLQQVVPLSTCPPSAPKVPRTGHKGDLAGGQVLRADWSYR